MDTLLPGAAHPNRPEDPQSLAATFAVPPATVAHWLERGLPISAGLIDPVLAADWIARHDLAGCRILARRWRLWLDWFRVARDGLDREPRRLRVRRVHSLHLPHAVDQVCWWIPRLPATSGHIILASVPASAAPLTLLPASWRVEAIAPVTLREEVELRPAVRALAPELQRLVCDVAGDFAYGWRHHRPGEAWSLAGGTCLDAAMALGSRLSAVGRPWRIVAGVIARTAIAGPHLWLEVEDLSLIHI
jgi:hypothetical protein